MTDVICTAATSVTAEHRSKGSNVNSNKRSGSGWYAHLSDEKKAEHLQKLRMARQQKKSVDLSVNVNVPRFSATQLSSGNFCNEIVGTILNWHCGLSVFVGLPRKYHHVISVIKM